MNCCRSGSIPVLAVLACASVCGSGAGPRAAEAATQPAAAAPSRQAIAQLGDHLRARGLDGVAAAAFATVPLTRDDAAEAARMLVAEHERALLEHLGGRAGGGHERPPQQGLMEIRDRRMPYWYAVRGRKPPGGRSLFISLHGGGGAPPAINQAQWENQKRLYAPDEGVYLVPRAPGDTWDLWHQAHVDVFFDRLISHLVALEDVDPDRVYLLGYSAGGDGVYQVAPRMADRFAAAAMMAGHPNETKPDGLRNLPFAIWVGANDDGHDRNAAARKWRASLAALAAGDPGGYRHDVQLVAGKGHWMDREDAAAVPWLATHTRDLRPERVVWLQDDVTHRRLYWLAVSEPRARARLAVARDGQRITVTEASPQGRLAIRLDDTMLDLDEPVVVVQAGHELFRGTLPRTIRTLATTLLERGDRRGLFSAEFEVPLPDS